LRRRVIRPSPWRPTPGCRGRDSVAISRRCAISRRWPTSPAPHGMTRERRRESARQCDNSRMALVDPEALRDPTSVALAATLRLAQRIEALLTEAGVDYVVQVEMYGRSFLFGTPRH